MDVQKLYSSNTDLKDLDTIDTKIDFFAYIYIYLYLLITLIIFIAFLNPYMSRATEFY